MISVVLCKVSPTSCWKRKRYDEKFIKAQCTCINDGATTIEKGIVYFNLPTTKLSLRSSRVSVHFAVLGEAVKCNAICTKLNERSNKSNGLNTEFYVEFCCIFLACNRRVFDHINVQPGVRKVLQSNLHLWQPPIRNHLSKFSQPKHYN